MTNELTIPNAALVDWSDPEMQTQIREAYGKALTDAEWKMFLGLGLATKLNPFLREIWAVKYGTAAASVFIGRDGYRRSAQNHPEYEYHFADAVYSNDVFKVANGQIEHSYSLKDRGTLVGAYCAVKRKTAGVPAVTYVELKEYAQTFGVWKTKPATMIKKVAEAQGLRASFQELFAGTYEESENWKDDRKDGAPTPAIVDAEVAPPLENDVELAPYETVEQIKALCKDTGTDEVKLYAHYKVPTGLLSPKIAAEMIAALQQKLSKQIDKKAA